MNKESDYLDDLIGKGPGDPDFHRPLREVGVDKPKIQIVYGQSNRRDGWPWTEGLDYDSRFDEDQEKLDV